MGVVTKTDLVGDISDHVAGTAGDPITKADIGRVVDATLEQVGKNLANGDEVKLTGFGTFRTSQVSGTGPDGKAYTATVVRFKAGANLKAAVA